MATRLGSVIRAATRRAGERLNILTFPSHEPYECMLARTGHQFWALGGTDIREWNPQCRAMPANYVQLDRSRGDDQLPPGEDFDLILSHHRQGQFQMAARLASLLDIPHVSIEHTLPRPQASPRYLALVRELKASVNLFISEYNREQWGWLPDEARVIPHGIDTDLFSPGENPREPIILSCVNDLKNRDWCCGYSLWSRVSQGLPVRLRGNNPGLSTGTQSVEELIQEYRRAAIYLNTSIHSPVPMAVLEAMSCGCALVTTATCMMPEFIKQGMNGYITNNEGEMREYLQHLLSHPGECDRLGQAARQTIQERFAPEAFLQRWQDVFKEVAPAY